MKRSPTNIETGQKKKIFENHRSPHNHLYNIKICHIDVHIQTKDTEKEHKKLT